MTYSLQAKTQGTFRKGRQKKITDTYNIKKAELKKIHQV